MNQCNRSYFCTQFFSIMTTLSLRHSILSLMLVGSMAVSVSTFAQGRRGGFGGGRSQSGTTQTSRGGGSETRAPGRANAVPSRTPQAQPSVRQERTTERATARPERNYGSPQGATTRSSTRNANPQRFGSDRVNATSETRLTTSSASAQQRSDFGNNRPNRPNGGNNYGNNGGNRPNRPDQGGNYGNNRPNRPNGGNNYGNRPNRPGGDRDYGRDYDGRHYGYHHPQHSNPRGYDNHFNRRYYDYYRHNSWSWSRPCRPPYRPWRPTPWVVHRPIVPAGWVWYSSAPSIYRVLGLQFGTVFSVSINHLFTYGYNIDGYCDNVIYLRDVPMLNFNWPNVMLNYAPGGGLASAMFSNSFATRDLAMYDRLYSTLCGTYGTPVEARTTPYEGTVSWWGGSGQGYVTLNYYTDQSGRFYTNLTVGN